MSIISSSKRVLTSRPARALLRRLGVSVIILLAIAYLTLFGLIVGERGLAGLPARPLDAAVEAARRTLDYVVNHPHSYQWQRQNIPASQLVLTLFGRSAGLLLVALGVATAIGVPLGIRIALLRRVRTAPLVLLLSVLGISTPSFLLGMLFWVANIQAYRLLGSGTAPLPPTGFGWDLHLVMPVLVLAARPLAQIVQITYVALSDALREDYIRTAQAKGLAQGVIVNRHALRNVLIPILTTLSTSLRFSLASLPVVESFFVWPGVGLTLLQAIELRMAPLVTDLIVSLGLLFLLISMALDAIYQILDPRLRGEHGAEIHRDERRSWREGWGDFVASVKASAGSLLSKWRRSSSGPSLHAVWPSVVARMAALLPRRRPRPTPESLALLAQRPGSASRSSRWYMLRSVASNLPFVAGTLLVAAFVGLAVWGEEWAPASPYETHGVMMIESVIASPPFAPSSTFPWGSDVVGRDMQALVLAGARQTLTLALLGMLARMLVGSVLGILAGWWRGGWLDRLIHGLVSVWAAFPVTLFAMILILALGIQQGMSVFIIALAVVGWGEIAQFVRGQVLSLKPRLYIEAARAVGARTGRILLYHVLPHLWTPLLVLAVLEMGSILMLLAELGFLNIFLGGGFMAEVGQSAGMRPVVYYFSDVPEWAALLANIRDWWRSYPWLAWYPGIAFFVAILAFNLWGEGLRRLLEDTRINIGRLINRYTVLAACAAVFGGAWLAHSTTPMEMYKAHSQQFDVRRAMQDIQALSSPQLEGRESGTPGAAAAADYIATQMEQAGLYPAGENDTFLYALAAPRPHLDGVPRLEILDGANGSQSLVYRQDMVEATDYPVMPGECEGELVGMALGPDPGENGQTDPYHLRELDLYDKLILLRAADFQRVVGLSRLVKGVLLVSDDPGLLKRKYLFPQQSFFRTVFSWQLPAMYVSSQAADRLLANQGGWDRLLARADSLPRGQVALTGVAARVRLTLPILSEDLGEKYYHVIGFIPGSGALLGEGEGAGLDAQVIIISAYYDGLGAGPDGTVYPGANDNASGVAAMLEIARAIKASPVQPRKTIVFVAWSGGERYEGFSVTNAMGAKRGFNLLTVEAVIELSGVGAGRGGGIALGQGTSFSLVQLFQDAAGRVGVPITTRGRDPHFGMPVASGFGGRSALSAYISWDGSDQTAHTRDDTLEAIEPEKLGQVGQTTLLAVGVLAQAEAQESPYGPLTRADDYVQAARMFDEEQALQHIAYLASDELEGRRTGSPGGQAAGNYVADRFAQYGLSPAGADGTYFQPFTSPVTPVLTAPLLAITLPGETPGGTAFTRSYGYLGDYVPRIQGALGSGQADGQVVWLEDCQPSDFTGHDLAGKVALCLPNRSASYGDAVKDVLLEKQVEGVLLIRRDSAFFVRPSYRVGRENMLPLPLFSITEAVARDVLTGTSYTLDSLEKQPAGTLLSATVQMAAAFDSIEVPARNVLGLLPGSDPAHKDELVIIGAHYDHMGLDPDGSLFNGANDNASGVAVMLEIARLWQAQGFRPARSVLFAAWDAEEQYLVGSRYYVQHAFYPLDKTVGMLNLDMVGVGEEVDIYGRGTMAVQLAATGRVYSITTTISPMGGSDHVPFLDVGVPAALLSVHPKDVTLGFTYHRIDDDVQTMWPGSLRTMGVMAAHSLAAWSGGGPSQGAVRRAPTSWRDWILPTPTCAPPWPVGSMTCDHGQWAR